MLKLVAHKVTTGPQRQYQKKGSRRSINLQRTRFVYFAIIVYNFCGRRPSYTHCESSASIHFNRRV